MHGRMLLITVVVFVVAGCELPGINGAQERGVANGRPIELKYTSNPPLRTRLKVTDAEVYGWEKVSYFSYDLNDDGKPEYFIVDEHHANACTFVLVGCDGESILELSFEDAELVSESDDFVRDRGFFCCDQILILKNAHEGYYDFITIRTDGYDKPMQTWTLWTRTNGRYVSQRFHNELFFYTYDKQGPSPSIGVVGAEDGCHDFSRPEIRAYWSDMAGLR